MTVCPCCACGSSAAPEATAGWYSRTFAYALANGMGQYEEAISPVKAQLFPQLLPDASAAPTVLDVGVGAGPNMKYFARTAPNAQVVGLDPNPAMAPYCTSKAAAAGLQQEQFRFVLGDAQQLPFEAATFDAAVVTLVLCSVPDVPSALAELRRVVRPGGSVLFIEHVISPRPGLLRVGQQVLNPLQRLLADGCNLNRDTAAALEAAGFKGTEGLMRFQVEGLGSLLSHHVAGVLQV